MQEIIFATNNANKVKEINSILHSNTFKIISLKDAVINIDIEEPYDTLEQNSYIKAKTIFDLTQKPCFAEDTGLFVNALNGEPGVKSARYAGEQGNDNANINLLLQKLNSPENRTAFFKTIITYIDKDLAKHFEGICEGKITTEKIGEQGFGYDPIFVPNGDTHTFAQMNMEQKNKYSHRKKAVMKFIEWLQVN